MLLEIAAAAVVTGLALRRAWLPAGIAIGVVFAVLALGRLQHRWVHHLIASWFGMQLRRRRLRGPGVASLSGGYDVVTVPSGSRGIALGAVRDRTTWTVPLELPLLGVLNDDPPVPVEALTGLLTIEDVPLSAVRLLTMTTPASPPPDGPHGPLQPLSRLAARYLLLTLDTVLAAEVITDRGGSEAAVHQILRRCVARAEEVFAAAGIPVRHLGEAKLTGIAAHCLGPLQPGADGSVPAAQEKLRQVTIADTESMTITVEGPDAAAKLDQLTGLLPVPIVATAVVARPGTARSADVSLLVRVSGKSWQVRAATGRSLDSGAAALGLTLRRGAGEQVPLLRATTPFGVERAA